MDSTSWQLSSKVTFQEDMEVRGMFVAFFGNSLLKSFLWSQFTFLLDAKYTQLVGHIIVSGSKSSISLSVSGPDTDMMQEFLIWIPGTQKDKLSCVHAAYGGEPETGKPQQNLPQRQGCGRYRAAAGSWPLGPGLWCCQFPGPWDQVLRDHGFALWISFLFHKKQPLSATEWLSPDAF